MKLYLLPLHSKPDVMISNITSTRLISTLWSLGKLTMTKRVLSSTRRAARNDLYHRSVGGGIEYLVLEKIRSCVLVTRTRSFLRRPRSVFCIVIPKKSKVAQEVAGGVFEMDVEAEVSRCREGPGRGQSRRKVEIQVQSLNVWDYIM